MTVEISMPRGYITTVDDCDSDLLKHKWSMSGNGYANSRINGRVSYLHRIVFNRMFGRDIIKGEEIDHIDRNKLNNCRNNLRISTRSQNGSNRELQTNNTTGYRGVSLHRASGLWTAEIKVHGKKHHLGYYKTPESAATAYNIAAIEYRGEFAVLNDVSVKGGGRNA